MTLSISSRVLYFKYVSKSVRDIGKSRFAHNYRPFVEELGLHFSIILFNREFPSSPERPEWLSISVIEL